MWTDVATPVNVKKHDQNQRLRSLVRVKLFLKPPRERDEHIMEKIFVLGGNNIIA